MGKKGASKALKRAPSPAFWPISRKDFNWVIKPISGPHQSRKCLPILLILRNVTNYAKNKFEAKHILSKGLVKICGKIRRNEGFPVGLMDTIEFIPSNEAFRVIPSSTNYLSLYPIKDDEKIFKLCRIENKTTVKGGKTQINLHDGRSLLVGQDSEQAVEDFNTFDVLKIEMPNSKILGLIKFGSGVPVIVTDGANVGQFGKVVKIEKGVGLNPIMVTIERKNGSTFQSPVKNVFAVGDKEPWISLPEVPK